MEKSWFEMKQEIRRRYANLVWIPLKLFHERKQGAFGCAGYTHEYEIVRSMAILLSKRADGEKIDWSDTAHDHCVYAYDDGYKPAEVYERCTGDNLGLELVIVQKFDNVEPSIWRVNQDLVVALGLKEEGDSWVCPSEAYVEVIKASRDDDGDFNSILIRSEFLKDYLSARKMALRLTSYRQRTAVLEDASAIGWNNDKPVRVSTEGGRFEGRCYDIHEGGHFFGSQTAVFHISRNDVDFDDDVPLMGNPAEENVNSKSWTRDFEGQKLCNVEGEFWRNEWVEPAKESPRVKGDKISSTVSFVVEADGSKMSSDNLNNEDIGRWLWFAPPIIQNILDKRGSAIVWHTRDTGSIAIVASYPVHFGINEKNLITTYAHDVAKLPEWQKQIWSGFNVAPDGKVSRELLQSQVEANPASTQAPEDFLKQALESADASFHKKWGKRLFRPHEITDDIIRKTHRFRAVDDNGIYALAKDVARLTADSFDIDTLHSIVPLSKNEKRGSIKSLEKVLATVVPADFARKLMAPLVGAYDLRLGDAHLPSSKISEAYDLVQIDRSKPHINQGYMLIHMTVSVLFTIAKHIAEYKEEDIDQAT